jgi:hypothetical protein
VMIRCLQEVLHQVLLQRMRNVRNDLTECFGIRMGSLRDDSYWTSMENSFELIELSSLNKVSLVKVSSCSNTGSIRDDPSWTSRENSLELIELSSLSKVSLV